MFTSEILFSFLTLSVLEIILGIDNLIFIAIVVQNLPKQMQKKVRFLGLTLALGIRVLMLFGVTWVMTLTRPLFEIFTHPISIRDLLLIAGGLFLVAKSTLEMHHEVVGKDEDLPIIKAKTQFWSAVLQVALIDFVFSFDSILTAVGLTQNVPVIVAAVVVSMLVMLFASGHVADFLKKYPTFKVLALAFILMIGVLLMAEGLSYHIPRGYIYFAIVFAMLIEGVNASVRKRHYKDK